ncbi:uncharacterized protein MELLADRAFT_70665 [Melampsora larici-populina 98AG31]|uniref:DASH complex subunit SPC19 n=1 Tax=Melampsora larici-populina (strain 98AG31 / pathotype 3-4-7) TaxID=747676 RepID=F4R582_MELLP|nr:uncharacterized protein MELLADRAFT_70665 [Melampsora larici-populina 98AG31]EGG12002.1 hypothetical protein MELLADRAFT_70665 [Melampsora larici-populina 98AG31]
MTSHQLSQSTNPLISLRNAAQSLNRTNQNLKSCVETLSQVTSQLPRTMTITKNTQFFELVSVSEIKQARFLARNEMDPEINSLLIKSSEGLKRLQTREQLLRTTIEKRDLAYVDEEETVEQEEEEVEGIEEMNQIRLEKKVLIDELNKLEKQIEKQTSLINSVSSVPH